MTQLMGRRAQHYIPTGHNVFLSNLEHFKTPSPLREGWGEGEDPINCHTTIVGSIFSGSFNNNENCHV